MPPAIIVDDVSKKFARSLKRGMIYGLTDMARMALIPRHWRSEGFDARMQDETSPIPNPAPRIPHPASRTTLRPTEFWALRNVSFTVEQGETLALLGANGAGKSTLFSVLSGIYAPTLGQVSFRGRLQALIALGAGFHPALTGRENLYINAAILGMREKEVNAIYDSILDFAGIGPFIDAPIRNYSSGMLVRLAFSVAIHLDPDVLLIDEVLAVGDAAFQMKCARFTRELSNSGKTIVVVSHNMLIIQMMCQRAIWLEKGQIRAEGDTHVITRDYQKHMLAQSAGGDLKTTTSSRSTPAAILGTRWLNEDGAPCEKLAWGKRHTLEIEVEVREDIGCARLWVTISAIGKEGGVMGASMYDDGHYVKLSKGQHCLSVTWESIPLADNNTFQVTAGMRDWSGHVVLCDSYASPQFEIEPHGSMCTQETTSPPAMPTQSPLVTGPYRWNGGSDTLIRSIRDYE